MAPILLWRRWHAALRTQAGRRFRMPLYPPPTLLAMCGFVYILLSRPKLFMELRPVAFVLVSGVAVYAVRVWRGQYTGGR